MFDYLILPLPETQEEKDALIRDKMLDGWDLTMISEDLEEITFQRKMQELL
jgi:hypothetical protein